MEWKDVRNVLVWADDDHAARLAVDAAQVEDVAGVRIGAEDLLVVDQPEPALFGKQDRWHGADAEPMMVLLEDRANVDHRVRVHARRREPSQRRALRAQELAQRA